MKRNLLIRGARQLLTLHASGAGPRRGDALRDLSVIEDGSVLIRDGAISQVGPTRRVENLAEARSAEVIDAAGCVVMPGFVDACATLFGVPGRLAPSRLSVRGYSPGERSSTEDLAATLNYLRHAHAPALSFECSKVLASLLRHGTTTVEARTGFGLNAALETKLIRVLQQMDGNCLNVVPTYSCGSGPGRRAGDSQPWLDWIRTEVISRAAGRNSVRFVEAVCGSDGLSAADARGLLHAARSADLAVKVFAAGWPNTEAVAVAVEFDAVSITDVGVLSPDEGTRLARSRSVCILLPARLSEQSTAGISAGRRLVDMGAAVALGSGFAPSTCSTHNMQMVIAMACIRMGLTPEEAISAATVNAAHACGLAKRCGTLEFGKDADIIILNVSDYREIPLYFGTNLVGTVIRRGVPLYQSGSVTCAKSSSSV